MVEALPLTSAEVVLVFAPAVAGYALLTVVAVLAAWSPRAPARPPAHARRVAFAALAAMTLHVLLLWTLRYGWDPALALRNGWSGFVGFHGAFVLAWLALPGGWTHGRRRVAVVVTWLLVTSGAALAPFRYPIVASLMVPVLVIAGAGTLALAHALWAARARQASPDR